MSNLIALTPRKDKFQIGVSFAKKLGCKFDGQRKVWTKREEALWDFVDDCKRQDQTREQYLRANGLEIVGQQGSSPVNPATTYVGQASLDAAESIF